MRIEEGNGGSAQGEDRWVALRRVLAELYPREADQRRVVREAKLDYTRVEFDASAANSWSNIIKHARDRARIEYLLDFVREENPENEILRLIATQGLSPSPTAGPMIGSQLAWHGPQNARAILEKITGENSSLVPTSYLALGLRRARSVALIRLSTGHCGTGFLIRDNLLVTNHHVLPDAGTAADAVIVMDHQRTVEGLDAVATELRLLPGSFFTTSRDHDWTAVRVDAGVEERWGSLALRRSNVRVGDRVNIIQHPGGGYKQMSFFSNVVVFVGEDRIQYLTDTLPGSSGSPVFDREWNAVAVHHSGGWLTEPGSTDGRTFLRNEGIRIDVLMDGLENVSPA